MSKKNRNKKLNKSLTLEEIGIEARHRSRILFSQHNTVGRVIESKKYKPVKHRRKEEHNWSEE